MHYNLQQEISSQAFNSNVSLIKRTGGDVLKLNPVVVQPMTSPLIGVTRIEAARAQLNVAIHLFFADQDASAVYLLAVSAMKMTADLTDSRYSQITSVLARARNFFDHSERDSGAVLEIDPAESATLLFLAGIAVGRMAPISTEMRVFHLWFLAKSRVTEEDSAGIQSFSQDFFPDLATLSRSEQLCIGSRVLASMLEAQNMAI